MMENPLTGSRPWFFRIRHGGRLELRPNSRAGWFVTAAYAVAMVAISVLLLARHEAGPAEWIGWALLSMAMTAAFIVTAWRTSVPVAADEACGRNTGQRARLKILVALASAALIIVGASLGVSL
jgi:hypothetical protein